MAPTTDHAAADGQHVDRTHRRGRRQSHQECARKHANIGDERHVAAHAATGTSKTTFKSKRLLGAWARQNPKENSPAATALRPCFLGLGKGFGTLFNSLLNLFFRRLNKFLRMA